jgi:hypothetical protein
MASPLLPTPPSIARLEKRAFPVAILGLLLGAVGFFVGPEQFYRSWLLAFVFWTGVSVGCLSLSFIGHLTGGYWSLLIRRFLEAGTRFFPVLFVLFLPVALGARRLYPWTSPGEDPVMRNQSLFLNLPFFLARSVFYFAMWTLLAHYLSRWSRELDAGPKLKVSRRLRGLSGLGLVILGLTITFSAIDWGMSLNPHWFSHIYGILFMVGQALCALSFMVVCVARTSHEPPIADVVRPSIVQDLGKLMLAFTMLWGYVNLSQFLIIWSGNLAEETPFFLHRSQEGWQYVAIALVLFHFVVPFLLLLSRDLKRNANLLGGLAAFLFVVRYVDLFWLMAPDLAAHGRGTVPLHVHWLDVVLPVGLGGLWLWLFARQLQTRPVLPVGEAELAELLAAKGTA